MTERPKSPEPTAAARWKIQSECKNLHTDILSARCIVDRLRMQSDPIDIAQVTNREDVRRLAANIGVIADFVKSIEDVSNRPS